MPSFLAALIAAILSLLGLHYSVGYHAPTTPRPALAAATAIANPFESPATSTTEATSATTTETGTNATTPDQTTSSQNVKAAAFPSAASTQTEFAPANSQPSLNTPQNLAAYGSLANPDYVTQTQFSAGLQTLQNEINSLISQSGSNTAPASPVSNSIASGGVWNAIAATNKIDNLSGVTISNSTIDTASIPDLSGTYLPLTGGAITGTTTIAAALGVGTTTPVSQLDLEGWTVNTSGGTLTGGNPQFQINGTLDTTNETSHVIGAQWGWNTVGATAANVSGLRIFLNAGYTGTGITRAGDFNNEVSGSHAFNGVDEQGNIGVTAAAQGGYTNDSTTGDNIGLYAIGGGSQNVDIGVYSRAADDTAAPPNTVTTVGVAAQSGASHAGVKARIGGAFTISDALTAQPSWYTNPESAALLLDNTGTAAPLLIGRVNGTDAFQVTPTGGIISTSTTNEANFWQVLNSSGNPIFDIDSTDGNVGIGTTSPADNLVVSNASAAATLGLISAGDTAGSGNIRFDLQNGDGNKYSWQFSGGGNTLLKLQYNTATKWTIDSGGQLDLGSLQSPSNMLSVYGAAAIGSTYYADTAPADGLIVQGNVGIGTVNPYSQLQVTGPDAASSTSAFAVVNSASTTVFAVFDGGNAELSGSLSQSSDQRLKTNIQSLDASSSLSLIEQLNPVAFNWADPNQTQAPQLGFIAQQVQPIFPNLVSTTSPTSLTPDGTLSLNYIGLISPIVSAIQEIEKVSGAFARNLIAWLGDASNGIVDLFAQNIHAQNQLCVGSTCVTPAQFQAMVAAANASQSSGQESTATSPSSATANSPSEPPQIKINGNNPAIVQVGDTYSDLSATITAPQADLNLGIKTYLNGTLTSNIVIDTSQAATDTIDYVAADPSGLTSTTTRTIIVEAPSITSTDNASSSPDATSTPAVATSTPTTTTAAPTDATSTDATTTAQ